MFFQFHFFFDVFRSTENLDESLLEGSPCGFHKFSQEAIRELRSFIEGLLDQQNRLLIREMSRVLGKLLMPPSFNFVIKAIRKKRADFEQNLKNSVQNW